MVDVRASGTVAAFAAHIPLRHLLGLNVEVHRVASVASGARGPLHIVRGIERLPPVSALWNKIRFPGLVGDVPLCAFGKIIVANFGEIALLPDAAINERDLILREFRAYIIC